MSELLIRYHDDWSDEMDIDGFVLIEDGDWADIKSEVAGYFQSLKGCPWEFWVGTNESINFYGYDQWINHFHITELESEQAQAFADVCTASGMHTGTAADDRRFMICYGFFPLPKAGTND